MKVKNYRKVKSISLAPNRLVYLLFNIGQIILLAARQLARRDPLLKC